MWRPLLLHKGWFAMNIGRNQAIWESCENWFFCIDWCFPRKPTLHPRPPIGQHHLHTRNHKNRGAIADFDILMGWDVKYGYWEFKLLLYDRRIVDFNFLAVQIGIKYIFHHFVKPDIGHWRNINTANEFCQVNGDADTVFILGDVYITDFMPCVSGRQIQGNPIL